MPQDSLPFPGNVSLKWSDSQARKTKDAQSKVFDTGRKKPGGMSLKALMQRRISSLKKQALAIAKRKRDRIAPVRTDTPPGDAHAVPMPPARPLKEVDLQTRMQRRKDELKRLYLDKPRRKAVREAAVQADTACDGPFSDTEELGQRQRFHPNSQRARDIFWRNNTPTADEIIGKVRKVSRKQKKKGGRNPVIKATLKDQLQQRRAAIKKVNNIISLLREEACGKVDLKKPSNVLRLLFENVNSIGVFASGRARGQKLNQMRHLIKKYDIDVASFVETQVDWRQVRESSLFENLFAVGQDRRTVAANNVTDKKLFTDRNQRGGTAMMTVGRMSVNVKKVDRDETKLGRFC